MDIKRSSLAVRQAAEDGSNAFALVSIVAVAALLIASVALVIATRNALA